MHLIVETVEGPFEVAPGETFSFGRSNECTFCVDEMDRNISRVAGTISSFERGWVLANASSNRTLYLTDEASGNGSVLLPGHSHLLCEDRLRVAMHGTGRAVFSLTVVAPPSDTAPRYDDPLESPSTLGPPILSPRQREDLAALFWEYHAPPERRSPRPLTYSEAAVLIGDTGKALEHRVAYLRRGLLQKQYPSMELHELALFLIGTKALTASDFGRVQPPSPQ